MRLQPRSTVKKWPKGMQNCEVEVHPSPCSKNKSLLISDSGYKQHLNNNDIFKYYEECRLPQQNLSKSGGPVSNSKSSD